MYHLADCMYHLADMMGRVCILEGRAFQWLIVLGNNVNL